MRFDDFLIGMCIGILGGLFWGVHWSDWIPAIIYASIILIILISLLFNKIDDIISEKKRKAVRR